MKSPRSTAVFLLLASFLLVKPVASAQKGVLNVPVLQSSTACNPQDSTIKRYALQTSDALEAIPDHALIDLAELVLPIDLNLLEVKKTAPCVISLHNLRSEYAGGALTWNAVSADDGTVYDRDRASSIFVAKEVSNTEVRIDVTRFVSEWLDGRVPNNGLLLKTQSEGALRMSWVMDGRYSQGANAELVIHYSIRHH